MWNRPYIVAEISGEHRGSIENAKSLIRAAQEAGADAAKLQCFDPVRLALRRSGRIALEGSPWQGRDLLGLYRETHTPREWFPELFASAQAAGIVLFASVFDEDDVDFLETQNCPAYKISAFESDDIDLIGRAAGTRKPVIVSVNARTSFHALSSACRIMAWGQPLAFLHCVSKYPCPEHEADLRRIADLRKAFGSSGRAAGFSDHTAGIGVAARAVRDFGAAIVEKHIKLPGSDGPDASFALAPGDFRRMVDLIRQVRC